MAPVTLSRLVVALALAFLDMASAAPVVNSELLLQPSPPVVSDGSAGDSVKRGYAALSSGNLVAAEAALREAIKFDRKQAAAYVGMAEIAARKGETTTVETWLKRAVEAAPTDTAALRTLARYQYRNKRFAEAETNLRKALTSEPASIAAQLDLGEVQLRGLRNAKAAEATFRAAIANAPDHPGAHLALADALGAQGREAEALAEYETAAGPSAAISKALLAKARFQASRLKVDDAIATLNRLLAVHPDTAQALVDKGDLLLLKGDVPQAMRSYRDAVAAAPGAAAVAHFRLATLAEAQQSWREAEAAYRAAFADQPAFVPALNNLAVMFARRGVHLDEALRLSTRALELAPKEAAVHDTHGIVLRASGDRTAAAKAFERAIAYAPRNPSYQYHLGLVRAEQGHKRDAQAAFRKALDLDPKFRDADDARKQLARLSATAPS